MVLGLHFQAVEYFYLREHDMGYIFCSITYCIVGGLVNMLDYYAIDQVFQIPSG